ncbi:MAG: C-terminal binding protein [Actinobacteria bacterium]|nr:C-terminal binding protein [Actinomycetota bacterium]
MGFTVLVTDYAWASLEIERAILADVGAELLVAETGEEEELVALAPRADAILTNWKRVPEAALDAAPGCVAVARYGVGLDNIPVGRATELGILVCNVPDFCVEEVSDHVMALLLSLARRVCAFDRATKQGQWDLGAERARLPRLRGQTLGLVGFGNSAQALVPKALGFGMRVIACTPRLRPGVEGGVELTDDLAYLLSEADYVSIHAPASAETDGLIGEEALRRMKPTAYLINTSRGALVDEVALERALREGWIAGAGLDVLRVEPAPPEQPLLGLENAVVTPHAAFYSDAAIVELQEKAARNVATVLRGEVPAATVNPAVLEQPNLRLRASAAR